MWLANIHTSCRDTTSAKSSFVKVAFDASDSGKERDLLLHLKRMHTISANPNTHYIIRQWQRARSTTSPQTRTQFQRQCGMGKFVCSIFLMREEKSVVISIRGRLFEVEISPFYGQRGADRNRTKDSCRSKSNARLCCCGSPA